MTEQRHCPRCTATFRIESQTSYDAAYRCEFPKCGQRYWENHHSGEARWMMRVAPENADRLLPGPYVPPLARAAE